MKKGTKILALVLCLFMALTVLTACGGGDSSGNASYAGQGIAVEGDTIYIGVFQPTTGENGGGGMQEVLGTRYANKENSKVTIDGKEYKIELKEVDNQSDKTAAVTAAKQLISDKVVAVVGSYGSGVSIAAGPVFQEAKVPAVGASCSNPQVTLGNDFYFRVCLIDSVQGPNASDYALKNNFKKAAIIGQNGDDYSTGLCEFFKQAYTANGGEIVSEQTYQTNESDFKAILTTVKEANPDLIYAPSSITTAPLLIQQARALGITAPIMGTDTWDNSSLAPTTGKDSEGILFTTLAYLDENSEKAVTKDFVANFKKFLNDNPEYKKFNSDTDKVVCGHALGYDAYMTVYNALKSLDGKKLEKITSGDIRDALPATNFEGVTGSIVFDENGDVKAEPIILKIENGQPTLAK